MRGWFRRNMGVVLISLACALILFAYVRSQEGEPISFGDIPLDFFNVSSNLVPVITPADISVSLQGPRNIILGLERNQIKVYLDLKGKEKGHFLYLAENFKIKCPEGVRVVKITPRIVSVNLDPLITKQVAIKPTITGKPVPGYGIGKIVCDPGSLKVWGPESRLEDLSGIPTTPIDVSDISSNVSKIVKIDFKEKDLEIIEEMPIRVEINLVQRLAEKEFVGVPIKILQSPSSVLEARLREKEAVLILRGPAEVVETLSTKDIIVAVNVSDLSQGTYRLKPEITLPLEIEVVSIVPPTFEVTLISKITIWE